ncbi:MAG TPA: formimidoylglutamate deiminase [Burkholderiaceae bacterium]
MTESLFWAPRAWLDGAWADGVLLRAGADGRWAEVRSGLTDAPPGAGVLAGPTLPGLVDAHGHAFQRAFAGLAERREAGHEHDDFWSWRERMYAVAGRIGPAELQAIAAQLGVELLRGGYTQVCEFHYLQHDRDGRPYADPLALSWALADAAAESGIGLTLLPALYERAGFDRPALDPGQRRFALDADAAWRAAQRVTEARRPNLTAGLAVHSLRAARAASIARLRALAEGHAGPIHVHVAEQLREVDDCLAATGARPVQWLAREGLLDARWQLVHATHALPAEIDAVAAARAGVVICPSTEANLGDGLTDLPGWLAAADGAVALAVGSDSQATRAWREELRWLEYGQRLARRQRNVAAGVERGRHVASSAARLFERVLAGGAAAAFGPGTPWGFVPGARADLLVVDTADASLLGLPAERWLDALVFSSPGRPWRDVMVAGRFVVRDHRHERAAPIAARFEAAMHELWADAA